MDDVVDLGVNILFQAGMGKAIPVHTNSKISSLAMIEQITK